MLDKRYRVNQSFEVLLYETETGSCFKYKMHNKVGSGRAAYDMINANNAEALLSKVCTRDQRDFSIPGILVRVSFIFSRSTMRNDFSKSRSRLETRE